VTSSWSFIHQLFSVLFRRAYRRRVITFWNVSLWHFTKNDCKNEWYL